MQEYYVSILLVKTKRKTANNIKTKHFVNLKNLKVESRYISLKYDGYLSFVLIELSLEASLGRLRQ